MIVIAFAAAAVLASAVAAVLVAVVASVQGEDRHGELPHQAPSAIARGVRRLTGLHVCRPSEIFLPPTPFIQQATSRADRAQPGIPSAGVTGQPPQAEAGNVSGTSPDAAAGSRRPV
jgi:hypothetical protein